MTFRGLTWDHPRGYDALAEAARNMNDGRDSPLITWDKQPLEGFESAPIAELAAKYDLLVLDHPHIGEAVASDCLHPLEALYPAQQITAWEAQSVGPSLASYAWQGRTWALPLDVATQVMARHEDTIADAPECWDHIVKLVSEVPVAQSLAGPHAFLTLISMVAGLGGAVGDEELLPDREAEAALAIMHQLYAKRPKGTETLNPIALLEAMAGGDIALLPLVFGYVTYAQTGKEGQITFTDSLGADTAGRGGVLGGTGIGFPKHSAPSKDLLAHTAGLMTPETQRTLIPAFGGQPSARSAWHDAAVNEAWGAFYSGCLTTAENALLRPRFDGYIAFQTLASHHVNGALEAGEAETKTLTKLRQLWSNSRANARGQLDAA